ncbi:AAA family ATPase [Polyangium spumosum]|uniref:AAA family ATPase n=1 Tax=Polyangium spumosum TaxID=889282 RepID=A0A6N7PY82_9BACT|nr:ATP-binding protein [Polyangium spumosum]MRG97152.1 AAA family ATPase [Polyangium spumosum]
MIERVSFTNFKSLRKAEIQLGRFMVIVGPNGSGKTSVLDGLFYLAQATQRPIEAIMTGVQAPLNLMSRGAMDPMVLTLSARFAGVEASVQISVSRGGEESDIRTPPEWSGTIIRRWGEAEETITSDEDDAISPREMPMYHSELRELAQALRSTRKLRLDVERLAAAAYSDEETPRMRVDGEGLAPVLADLAARSPDIFQSIQDAARQVVPTLERIRTRRAKVLKREQQEIRIDDKPLTHTVERPYWGQQLVLDFKGAPDVPAPLASEGTLLVIGLLTALCKGPRLRLLLLDDIDKALHPRAQGELVAQLRKVLAMDPELQIVATSHSPYLLDHFKPEEVLVTALRPDGSTACAPLTEHPDFERWKSTTRAGELWSFVGEDWVTERASAETEPQ